MDASLATLWSVEEHEEEREEDTFVDAMGQTQTERLTPMPPPRLLTRGAPSSSSSSSFLLDRHTGTHHWARRGGDVENTEGFDDDVLRPAALLAEASKRRSRVQIQLNRTGTQTAPESAQASQARTDLYHGYNPLARTPKPLPPTRRGVASLSVVGAERNRGSYQAMEASHVPTLRVGAHDLAEAKTRAQRSEVIAASWKTSAVHLGGQDGKVRKPLPGRRAADVAPLAAERAVLPHAPTRTLWQQTPMAKGRITELEERRAAARAQPVLSSWDATAVEDRRRTEEGTSERALSAAPDSLGEADSRRTADPRQLTFDQVAAMAADVVLGTADSQRAREAALVTQHPTHALPLPTRVPAAKRLGPARGDSALRRVAESLAQALAPTRGRKGGADATWTERVVPTRTDETREGFRDAAQERRLPDDAVHARESLAPPEYEERRPLEGARRLGSKRDAVHLEPSAATHTAETWTAAVRAAAARSLSETTLSNLHPALPQPTDPAPLLPAPPVERRDGARESHRVQPLATGAPAPSLKPPLAHTPTGRETPSRLPQTVQRADVRAPAAGLVRRGVRE